ncbi:MAG TPA: YidC/Oxa1 family membrane protein insertase [Candidatus Saccharimonadales bacterium]|nr:YidC/Oxa1 family membrane protein insertase [Candidatus Saccharimonadales bacterium]
MWTAIKAFFKVILYKPLFNLLIFFAWLIPGHSIGWGIIGVTLIVRLLLWHTSVKALQAPLQLRQHAPELKKIQEKYKDDKQAQAQAQMAFYKENGVNPLSGCLPLLIQLPILVILYHLFFVITKQAFPAELLYHFTPHVLPVNPVFLGINLFKPDRFWILPAVAAVAQFFQTRHIQQLNPTTGAAGDPMAAMNKQMMYLFPVMIFFFVRALPAGIALYYLMTSLFSLAQQVYVAKTFKSKAATAAVTVRSKKNG